jgi:hypothetical protein
LFFFVRHHVSRSRLSFHFWISNCKSARGHTASRYRYIRTDWFSQSSANSVIKHVARVEIT